MITCECLLVEKCANHWIKRLAYNLWVIVCACLCLLIEKCVTSVCWSMYRKTLLGKKRIWKMCAMLKQ
jgi:hypothetical protein